MSRYVISPFARPHENGRIVCQENTPPKPPVHAAARKILALHPVFRGIGLYGTAETINSQHPWCVVLAAMVLLKIGFRRNESRTTGKTMVSYSCISCRQPRRSERSAPATLKEVDNAALRNISLSLPLASSPRHSCDPAGCICRTPQHAGHAHHPLCVLCALRCSFYHQGKARCTCHIKSVPCARPLPNEKSAISDALGVNLCIKTFLLYLYKFIIPRLTMTFTDIYPAMAEYSSNASPCSL